MNTLLFAATVGGLIDGLFKDMSIWRIAAIAAGAIIVLQLTGMKDFSNTPIIGALLKAIGIIKEPVVVQTHIPDSTGYIPTPQQEQQSAEQQIELRCQKLALELLDLRHFASERPTDAATAMLKACDTLGAELQAYHKEHTK